MGEMKVHDAVRVLDEREHRGRKWSLCGASVLGHAKPETGLQTLDFCAYDAIAVAEKLERDADEAEATALADEDEPSDTTRRLMDYARGIMARQDAAPPADAGAGDEGAGERLAQLLSPLGDGYGVRVVDGLGGYCVVPADFLRSLLAAERGAKPGAATRKAMESVKVF